MPSRKVMATEYQCAKCGYRWINRRNGKEGSKPKRCAKCKKWDWDEGYKSRTEKQLTRCLIKIEEDDTRYSEIDDTIYEIPTDICTTFLTVYPRPTVEELRSVLSKKEKDARHDLMQQIIKSRKGILNTASTRYRYFEHKKRFAKP
jgi:hypothetical protein